MMITDTNAPTLQQLATWWPSVPAAILSVFADACRIYGINPDPDARPRQLRALRAGGDPDVFEPYFISMVTEGGFKLRHPMDEDTRERLEHLFGLVRMKWDPNVRQERRIVLPLPADLTLPVEARTGFSRRRPEGRVTR